MRGAIIILLAMIACGTVKVTAGQTGMASFYAERDNGYKTASGQRFDEKAMTAAHPHFPFGTQLRVTNASNGRSVVVTINDRGPYKGGRIIDLSKGAAERIGLTEEIGITPVRIERL